MTPRQTSLAIALAFLGGAAAGAAAVYVSNPDNRKKIRSAVDSSRRLAGRVPDALREVKSIAADAMRDGRNGAKQFVGPQLA